MCNATVNQFGLGLGSDRREWCCRCRREWFALSRLGLGAGRRREWFGSVIANGSDRREWLSATIGAIGDGEARRRLGLGVRRLGLGATATGFGFQKNKN